jgi:hypothetical protein
VTDSSGASGAELVAAWATVGALFGSLGLLWNTLSEKKRSQASTIAGWSEHEGLGEGIDNGAISIPLHIRNASTVPVYQLRLLIGPMVPGVKPRSVRFWHVFPPGEWNGVRKVKDEHAWGQVGTSVEVEFMDSNGRSWRRDATGRLHRVRDVCRRFRGWITWRRMQRKRKSKRSDRAD